MCLLDRINTYPTTKDPTAGITLFYVVSSNIVFSLFDLSKVQKIQLTFYHLNSKSSIPHSFSIKNNYEKRKENTNLMIEEWYSLFLFMISDINLFLVIMIVFFNYLV